MDWFIRRKRCFGTRGRSHNGPALSERFHIDFRAGSSVNFIPLHSKGDDSESCHTLFRGQSETELSTWAACCRANSVASRSFITLQNSSEDISAEILQLSEVTRCSDEA